MSEQREVEVVIGSMEFANLPIQEQKARMARVLDRNLSISKLHVDLPNDLHGEWVPSDDVSVAEKERLGFKIDTEYAPKSINKSNRHIDAIFMTIPKGTKEAIDSFRQDEYNRAQNPKKNSLGQTVENKEEVEFKNSPVGLPLSTESTTTNVDSNQIASTLRGSS
jgi:hypothetical protein